MNVSTKVFFYSSVIPLFNNFRHKKDRSSSNTANRKFAKLWIFSEFYEQDAR